jgi:DNA polymerase III epsilon subunit-like protein
VDAAGVWSLIREEDTPRIPLLRRRFAVVDVETTGGGPGDRVTEVAVVHVDQGVVGRCFHTLVNPGRAIPPWIQRLTGITDRMVAAAPPFEGIADELTGWLEGRVFVAHNEPFDRRFVQSELLAAASDLPEASASARCVWVGFSFRASGAIDWMLSPRIFRYRSKVGTGRSGMPWPRPVYFSTF